MSKESTWDVLNNTGRTSDLEEALLRETVELRRKLVESRPTAFMLRELFKLRASTSTHLKKAMLEIIRDHTELTQAATAYTSLRETHDRVQRSMRALYKTQRRVTPTECRLHRTLLKETKREILTSAWVGPVELDIYIPCVQSPGGQIGFAIESDGGLHKVAPKSLKDEVRNRYLSGLNLLVWRLDIEDTKIAANIAKTIVNWRPPTYRTQANSWLKIISETLACSYVDPRFSSHFPDLIPDLLGLTQQQFLKLTRLVAKAKAAQIEGEELLWGGFMARKKQSIKGDKNETSKF